MSSPDIVSILDNSKELDRVRKEQEDILSEINKLHKKLQATPEVVEKPGDNSLARLKFLYTQAKELSESEASISNLLINQIDALLPTGPQGQTRRRIEGNEQKRKRVKTESDISRLTPSMRGQLEACANLKGEQYIASDKLVWVKLFLLLHLKLTTVRNSVIVAARVTPRNADKDEWFVVKVIHFDKESKEFEVLDEEPGDDEESSGQRQYKLPMANIIPFPKSNDPSSAQDFPPGRHVLAVYPGTTALYKATVVQGHRRRKTEDYVLEFDDDEEDGSLPQRTVPFHKVVPLPEGHRQ
ncbi:SAGA-associated factor 29 A [Glycine soja]